jgi:hypothetical protein
MGAGLSQKQITARIYGRLKSVQYELAKVGVNTVYKKATASRYAEVVWFEGDGITFPVKHIDGGFNISFNVSHASNGECFGFPGIYFVYEGERKNYGWLKPDGSFEQGLARIKELFSAKQEKN